MVESKYREREMNKVLNFYQCGFLDLNKLIMMLVSTTIVLFVYIITIPLWWNKYIQVLLWKLGNVLAKVIDL